MMIFPPTLSLQSKEGERDHPGRCRCSINKSRRPPLRVASTDRRHGKASTPSARGVHGPRIDSTVKLKRARAHQQCTRSIVKARSSLSVWRPQIDGGWPRGGHGDEGCSSSSFIAKEMRRWSSESSSQPHNHVRLWGKNQRKLALSSTVRWRRQITVHPAPTGKACW